MVGLLLVTHGDLAKSLLNSAALIMGEAPLIESYGLYHGDDVDELKDKVQIAIQRLYDKSEGDGVLILVDLFGGSPSNATARSLHDLKGSVRAACVTGVNLPMLLEVATSVSYLKLDELKKKCLSIGPESILDLCEMINL